VSFAPDTALRLARFFGTSSEFWLGLQAQYDLDVAADELGDRLEKEVKVYSQVA
jgi:plasmid maintenance system antidote protein VapI